MNEQENLMTWNAKQKRWFKKFRKKQFTVSASKLLKLFPDLMVDQTKEGSYLAANAWWIATKTKFLDAAGEKPGVFLRSDEVLTVGHLHDKYVAKELQILTRKQKSLGRYDNVRWQSSHFVQFLNRETPVADLQRSSTLLNYHELVSSLIIDTPLSHYSARDLMSEARRFIRWSWRQEYIRDLPRNLSCPDLAISCPANDIKVFDPDELSLLMDHSPERSQLYWLLMLNTGMQQKDISELNWSEVDLDLGRIVRKRSKTRRFQNSPTVNYQLWECTSKLLQEFSSEGDPVLKNRSGESLYKQSLKANGKAKKSDSIKNAFFRAKQKAGIQKPLKLLRKTSATLIAEEFGEGLAALFLGHSPKSVAGRHYIRPSQKRLDEAVEWLGSKITEMVDPTS